LLGSGLLGYSLATWDTKALSSDSDVANQRPRYGSAEDFKRAIADLKSAFSDDVVSIDPDVLYAHGFSVNDYHPGIHKLCIVVLSKLSQH
jgi:D-lactate dehydrogenase (cytochrome)